jgi:hypothetical protein
MGPVLGSKLNGQYIAGLETEILVTVEVNVIGTAIDQKTTDEDGRHCFGCRTAIWKERRNHIMVTKQQPKFLMLRLN